MPIYEYECDNQGHRFEKWQSIQEEPVKTCPVCGSSVHKVLHPAGIIFKGSGWYITDSRKRSSTAETGEKEKSEAKTEAKGEAKKDPVSGETKVSTDKKDS